jgi:hypothetical protein
MTGDEESLASTRCQVENRLHGRLCRYVYFQLFICLISLYHPYDPDLIPLKFYELCFLLW